MFQRLHRSSQARSQSIRRLHERRFLHSSCPGLVPPAAAVSQIIQITARSFTHQPQKYNPFRQQTFGKADKVVRHLFVAPVSCAAEPRVYRIQGGLRLLHCAVQLHFGRCACASMTAAFVLLIALTFILLSTHACLQHLGWPAPAPSKLCSVGVQPWDGAEVEWDYVNWTHEPQSVGGAIYRCCALARGRCCSRACCATCADRACSSPAGDEITDY